jgi:3-deoxy-D-arabino-heptulosonate 7-phosphate (DAHP) synthase
VKYGVSTGDDCVGWGVVTAMAEAVDEAEDEAA